MDRPTRTPIVAAALLLVSGIFAVIGCGPMTPGGGPGGNPNGRHHPGNFADPAQHSTAAKFRTEDCTACHGAGLDGQGAQVDPKSLATAPQGCNSHHNLYSGAAPDAWRTDCTFCHGDRSGAYDSGRTGAPPRDLKDVGCTPSAGGCVPVVPDAAMISGLAFKSHRIHLRASATHLAYDCTTCHPAKPTDALSPGHWIVGDATPGVVELSPLLGGTAGAPTRGGTFAGPGTGTCNATYCHGTGQTGSTKSVKDTAPNTGCAFCHALTGNTAAANPDRTLLTWPHQKHLALGASGMSMCGVCHAMTASRAASPGIIDTSKHLDGLREIGFVFPTAGDTMTWDPGSRSCTGNCHSPKDAGTVRPHLGVADSVWSQ